MRQLMKDVGGTWSLERQKVRQQWKTFHMPEGNAKPNQIGDG